MAERELEGYVEAPRATSSPLHVLVLPSWLPEPGDHLRGIFFLDQALALQRAGHRVGVIYPAQRAWTAAGFQRGSRATLEPLDSGLDVLRSQSVRVPRGGPANALRFAIDSLRLYRRYAASRGRPDVIHAQSALWAALGAALIRRMFGVPFVLTEHLSSFLSGDLASWQKRLIPWGFAEAAELVAVSHALARSLAPMTPMRAIHVVPNTVDTDYFQRGAPRHGAGFTLLTIGNLLPNKRVDRTLRAFARALAGEPEARLEIGGDGRERPRLEALAKTLGVQSRVRFLGQLDRHEVRAAMQRADLFMLASERETFGVVLIEALACGLPVIATRAGGPDDIVTREVGYLVDRSDEPGLASALLEARARVTREGIRWSEQCADYAKQRFGYTAFAAQLTRVLRRAVQTP